MSIKRSISNLSPSNPKLLDAVTGYCYSISFSKEFTIGRRSSCPLIIESTFISRLHCIIKYENNQFIIYDNNSSSGTFVNCVKIRSGKRNFTILNHGDLISFGTEKKMTFIFKFMFNHKLSNTDKKPRFDHNYTTQDVLSLNEKYGNHITKIHSGIVDLKVDQLICKNEVKTQINEFQNHLQESIKTLSDSLNVFKLKQKECSVESFKANVYSLLDDYFQCPICNDVIIKVSITHCNHAFCQKCLLQWLAKNKNCPICRTSLKTSSQYPPIDSFITDLCELLGGTAKEQRDIMRKEMLDSESSGNKGRKRQYARRNQSQATRISHVNLRSSSGTVDLVDLTNSPI